MKALIQSKGHVLPSSANKLKLGSQWETIRDDEDITLDEVHSWSSVDEKELKTLELQNLSAGNAH